MYSQERKHRMVGVPGEKEEEAAKLAGSSLSQGWLAPLAEA
jgi:hypothetical protein